METTIDLTQILVALIGVGIPAIMGVATYLINRRIKDQQLRDTMVNLAENALGIVQRTSTGLVYRINPQLRGVVSDKWAPGVQYYIDHGAEAIKRFDVSPQRIEEKLIALEGRKEIETNQAISASSLPVVVPPVGPTPSEAEITRNLNMQEIQRHRSGA